MVSSHEQRGDKHEARTYLVRILLAQLNAPKMEPVGGMSDPGWQIDRRLCNATYQSLQLAQWIIGDPSSGFLQMQYGLEELFLVTLVLPDGPFTFMFSFSSCAADAAS